MLSLFEIGVNAEKTTSTPEPGGAENSSGGNTVLDRLFNLVTPFLVCLGDECRWNYMP